MTSTHRNKRLSQEVEDAFEEGTGMRTTHKNKNRRSIVARDGLMASVVKAASALNNILLENCSICTVYCDKQVQYEEYAQQQYEVGVGAMEHLYSQLNPSAGSGPATDSGHVAAAAALGADGRCDIRNEGDHHHHHDDDDESCRFINQSEMKTPPSMHGSTNHASLNSSERIEAERYYREFLFDEESVVRTVGSRGAVDDEE
mmetsp:Transcript_5731/g.14203  ORF Transcript_5731/g.14203 Transcript_5731/m.14203 type:complete len:202 (+) Transcript_5731:359-964(+)